MEEEQETECAIVDTKYEDGLTALEVDIQVSQEDVIDVVDTVYQVGQKDDGCLDGHEDSHKYTVDNENIPLAFLDPTETEN